MKLYSENDNYKLYQGNMLDMLEVIEKESIDSIITDPPYGLTSITKRFGKENSAECKYGTDGSFQRLSKGFMGKEWDGSGIEYNIETWQKCLEVLKPGGYLLAFGGTRTYHRIACAIEDAGFEIRDCIMWLYGSGFPKSMNIGLAIDKKNGVESKVISTNKSGKTSSAFQSEETTTAGSYEIKKSTNEWNGWGTALKPAYEPIIVARKPFKGSCIDNVLQYGTGGINIDECRVGTEERSYKGMSPNKPDGAGCFRDDNWQPKDIDITVNGRFPANLILTYDDTDFEEVCSGMPDTNKKSASRYFYCAKASKRDRDEGLDEFEDGNITDDTTAISDRLYLRKETPRKNIHPTVKPTDLMQYLIRLVSPKGATILDPFNGSGSTGKAVMYENKDRTANYKYIGIELTEEYLPIAKARIEHANNVVEEKNENQIKLF